MGFRLESARNDGREQGLSTHTHTRALYFLLVRLVSREGYTVHYRLYKRRCSSQIASDTGRENERRGRVDFDQTEGGEGRPG